MLKRLALAAALLNVVTMLAQPGSRVVWQIGQDDARSDEFALSPNQYEKFVEHDFGYEDRYFLVGYSSAAHDFPYVVPGPDDTWGGTSSTAGWRTHEVNILFSTTHSNDYDKALLTIALTGHAPTRSVVKVSLNGRSAYFRLQGGDASALTSGSGSAGKLELELKKGDLRDDGNCVTITVLEGSWIAFDYVSLTATGRVDLKPVKSNAYLRGAWAADYEFERSGKRLQPLIVDVEALTENKPQTDNGTMIRVVVDKKEIYKARIDTARYQLEAPMPAVKQERISRYQIFADKTLIGEGRVKRSPQRLQTAIDYVDTRLGSGHSRWMIAPGPWMPFGMVKLSPDNQDSGWQSGYQPSFETVGCFSHVHEWTMAGLGMMPTHGPLQTHPGSQYDADSGYRSRIDKDSERSPIGYYAVRLKDTDIFAELTATTRASMQRYTFPKGVDGRVMIDLHIPAEYDYQLEEVMMRRVADNRIEGYSHQLTPRVWGDDADQDYTLNFVIEFSQPIKKIGYWKNDSIGEGDMMRGEHLVNAGMYVEFDTDENPIVEIRTGISPVSIANAADNLEKEITSPCGWDFNAVVEKQREAWYDLLSRIDIATDDRLEKVRFYTNMFRAYCRNTWSDANGEWVAPDGKVHRFDKPGQRALGGDAFWNTFWNLNQLWNLITPEWTSQWVNSQLAMYDTGGWLAKGPAGMKYIPVMVAEHEIPLIVGAWQMKINDFDVEKAFEAVKKMQTTTARKVYGGFAGNRDLEAYLKYHYVPYDKGRFSNTMEYSFDDWAVGQLALSLGKTEDYKMFNERGSWWKNAFDMSTGYATLKDAQGNVAPDFDPFRSGANQHYVEGNAWQLSFFVPQDVPALVDAIGKKAFTERLQWGFGTSERWRYNAPGDQYWDFPVVQGNQQSMHFAFLFNWAGQPWLTQRWSRSVVDRYYGSSVSNAYLGDEDQGQMSAWLVMAAIGLFQTDGGARYQPIYEIGSPLYEQTVINLGGRYGRGQRFTIVAKNASRRNKYVQSATLNGKPLNTFYFPATELLKGGSLELIMGDKPNKQWGQGNGE